MFEKLKQYQDIRNQAKRLQSQLATETVAVEKQGLRLVLNGNQEVISLEIDPERLAGDKSALERDLKDALNEALKKVQHIMAAKIRSGGFNFPGLA